MAEQAATNRLVFPALQRLYDSVAPYSYSVMRFALGAALVPHGVQKLFMHALPAAAITGIGLQPALFWAYLVGMNECFGALCLALGLFTRFVALTIAIEMLVIVTTIQWHFGYFWTQRGLEFPLLIFVWCIAIFFKGGGSMSVDRRLKREL
jgi:putative oxidoreductase